MYRYSFGLIHNLLPLKIDANVPMVSKKHKNFFDILKVMKKRAGSGSKSGAGSVCVVQWYGSADPDPYQNATVPERCRVPIPSMI
jgi:hypothetical protein